MIGVIYWSGTGNTEAMAEELGKSIETAGQEVFVKAVSETTIDEAAQLDKLALGCAAMGSEQLEEAEFEPFIVDLEDKLKGKKVVIFGSYGWGGTWLEEFKERLENAGATVVADPISVLGSPDDACVEELQAAGKVLVEA